MVAIEATTIWNLYMTNRVRAGQRVTKQSRSTADTISAVVLAELVTYIGEELLNLMTPYLYSGWQTTSNFSQAECC